MSARDIIVRPLVTEKTMKLQDSFNKVTFEVAKNANKVFCCSGNQGNLQH